MTQEKNFYKIFININEIIHQYLLKIIVINTLNKYNIYLYDGNHEEQYHYNSLDEIYI